MRRPELDDGISQLSHLVEKASKVTYVREQRARRTKIISTKFTQEERDYIKEAAAICNRSAHSWQQITLLREAAKVHEEALKNYESEARRRARTGLVPEVPIVPTDSII